MTATGWRVRRIDEATWLPADVVDGVESVSIRRSTGKDAPLLESASLDVTGLLDEGYYRVEMADGGIWTSVATMLFSPENPEYSKRAWGGGNSGRSVLAPASEKRFEPGSYAPRGADGAEWIAARLAECIVAPVETIGTFSLSEHAVFDIGASYLDGIWKVLDAVGWCMQVSGEGVVTVREIPAEPKMTVSESSGILMPGISRTPIPVDTPNVLRVYDGDDMAEAVDDDPESPTSVQARGRVIEAVEDGPTRREGETLQQYAERRLAELTDVYETYSVRREHAGMLPYDIWDSNLPEPGLCGLFRVTDQAIECERGVTVEEKWGRLS